MITLVGCIMKNKVIKIKYCLFLLIFLIENTCYSQHCTDVEELFRKRHKIANMTYGHPYTTFDRHVFKSFDVNLKNIRDRIINENKQVDSLNGPVYKAYQAIYNNVTPPNSMPTDNGMEANKVVSPLALYAKNCAFVFLIGLDGNGNPLDNGSSTAARNAFRDKALNAFENLDGEIDGDAVSPWAYAIPVYGPVILSYNVYNREVEFYSKMQGYTRSLIIWLQAYDLLKASYEDSLLRNAGRNPWGFGDADRNSGDCSPRNKLRKYTRDIYKYSEGDFGITEHAIGWKKNHGIAAASAVLMSAQVLNDAGVETNYLTGLLGWLWGDGFNIPRPNYSPINWNKLGQNGLVDNLFIGKHKVPYFNPIGFPNLLGGIQDIIIKDVPQSPRNKITDSYSVYAEGPGYASYGLFDCGIPAMITQKNLYPNWSDEPFIKKNEIINIFNWYNNLLTENNTQPSFDNSEFAKNGILAITGIAKFNRGIEGLNQSYYVDYVAMIGGNNIPLYTNDKPKVELMGDAGNLVLRNSTKDAKHTFYMLFEKDLAVDGTTTDWTSNHEDDDMGSFSFMAKDKNSTEDIPLAIDPPYTGWNPYEGANTNKYWMHNTIEIDPLNIYAFQQVYKNPKYELLDDGEISNNKAFDLTFDFRDDDKKLYGSVITRNVQSINSSENFYYFITDYIDAHEVFNDNEAYKYVSLNLNGNGNSDIIINGKKSYNKEYILNGDSLHCWTYPCSSPLGWGLTAHISALNNNFSNKKYIESPLTYNNALNGTQSKNISGGYHTRLRLRQPVNKTIFQSFLYPQKCDWPLPKVTKDETADHVTTKIRFINGVDTSIQAKFGKSNFPKYINDTASHFHFARWEGGIADTLTNPFNLPTQSNIKLYLNAQKAFIKHNTYAKNIQGYKYCPASYINIKYVSLDNGSYLKFNDTFLIKSPILMNAYLGFQSRYSYIANITPLATNTTADSIEIYLADVGRGKDMVALTVGTYDTLPSRYDSLTRVLYMAVPTKAVSFFISEKQNCVNCYFPPTWMNIVDTFEADDKLTHVLGNKLTIKQPNGLLQITNSAKIKMCEGVYLRNKNLLIIEGPCQSKAYEHKTCKGIDSMVAAYSDNSSLTINNNSALVLELGSQTYVRNGGAIYVKQGGSLIVKAGAYLEIGDSGTCNQGWGEIIAEPGAYIHIEPGAQISYRSTIGDTTDRNMFIIPTASGLPKAYEGVAYFIKTILYQDTILPLTFPTYPICGLDSTSPIINKPWGYTNFAKPLATFQAKNDTLCPNEPLYIKLNRILNDARTTIEVCRVDSFKVYSRDRDSSVFRWQDTCIIDTLITDSILPDPVCKEPRTAPDDLTFWFKAGTTHRLTIRVWNDCGIMDDTISYIYAMDTPQISISMPTEICEGIGTATVSITKLNKYPVSSYAFEVTEIPDSSLSKVRKGVTQSFSRTYNDTLPNAYNFEDYYFKSGRKYAITLLVNSVCGSKTFNTEVTVPLAAKIILERPTVYSQQLDAATSVKLHGYTSSIDSFKWEPTTWLDSANSLTPISTPNENITYVLSAYKNGCTTTDTAYIKYNKYANAGHNDTLCYTSGQAVVLGNTFDYSMFLGWMCYYDTAAFNKRYNNIIIDNNLNIHYFTAFMHHDLFKKYMGNNLSFKAQYNNFVTKHLILNQNWYPEYLNMLYDNSISKTAAFNYFVDRINEGESTVIRDNLDSIARNSIIELNLKTLFDNFKTFNDEYLADIKIYWNGITDYEGKFELRDIGHNQLIYQLPTQTQKYTLTVIAYNTTEIDEITVMVDTVLTPLFYPALQFDSTVYFMNNTEPISSATNYEWNFGDGSPNSFEQNPIHTFPAFDSNYVVCLTASNKCNSWQYCDTVWVDSLHLGVALKTANKTAFFETNTKSNKPSSMVYRPSTSYELSTNNIQLSNYPNPFNQSTIIDYQIWQSFNQAELRITNILGQVLFSQKLQKPIDKVEIDGSNLANGLYYYSIVVDNSVKLTKTMSVIH